MKKNIQSIILLAGSSALTRRLSQELTKLGASSNHYFLSPQVEGRTSAERIGNILSEAERQRLLSNPSSLIISNLLRNIKDAQEFWEGIEEKGLRSVRVCVIAIKESEKQVGEAFLAVDRMQVLLRDGGGSAGSVVYDSSKPDKLLVDALAIMANDKQQVTICGQSGTGKTTLANAFRDRLGYESISSGSKVAEQIASENGMELEVFLNDVGHDKENKYRYDERIDAFNVETGATRTRFALDSRLGRKFIPDTYGIYTTCNVAFAAERRIADQAKNPEKYKNRTKYASVKDAIIGLSQRDQKDQWRYMEKYSYDLTDTSLYEHVVDSGVVGIEQMVEDALSGYCKFLFKKFSALCSVPAEAEETATE